MRATQDTNSSSALQQVSNHLAKYEKKAAGFLCFALLALILGNVVSRAIKLPVFWIDELAIYTMIWMAFLAASAAINSKGHIAVSLVTDLAPENIVHILKKITELIMAALGLGLASLAWLWYDPIGLLQSGGDLAAFANSTLNFIYSEPTIATGLPKYLFWLIMPIFSIGMTIHSLALLFTPKIEEVN